MDCASSGVLGGHSGGDYRRFFLALGLDRIPRQWEALGLVATSECSSFCVGIAVCIMIFNMIALFKNKLTLISIFFNP